MKSPSIETLYASLDKHIKLAQSYSEIDNLAFIIKACRLKPADYMEYRSEKIVLYRKWFDEFGNSFNIAKNKKIKIIYGDLLNRSDICTDIYYGLSLSKISKMSKLLYLSIGKDEDTKDDFCNVTFLGLDNYLRSYLYMYDEWRQVSPLTIGMANLECIAKNLDVNYFQKLHKKENYVMPCCSPQAWLSFMPVSEQFIDVVRKECNYILPLFTKDY